MSDLKTEISAGEPEETPALAECPEALDAASPAAEGKVSGPLELTILMPCLNEAETMETCIAGARRFLDASQVAGEILVVDNGSTDGSPELAAANGARVVSVSRRGYGAALLGGIRQAHGRYVVMGDADGSYDFSALEPFLAALGNGADLVIGNRFQGGIAPGAMPFSHRYFGNPLLSFLGRRFYRIGIGDFHCGLRAFSRDAISSLQLQTEGMEFASEMVVKAALDGLRIVEVPTALAPDGRSRPPHLRSWTDGWRHLRFLLLHSPRWLFYYPGMIMIGIGALLAAILIAGNLQIAPGIELGPHTLITACFAVVIGVQLVAFSLLAQRNAVARGILPPGSNGEWLEKLTLERMLKFAFALFVLGAAGFGSVLGYWFSLGLGEIEVTWLQNAVAVSMTVVTVSLQLAFTAFLASAFALE